MVLGLEFFETGFGLGDLGAEFLLGLLGLSPGKSSRARLEGDGCIVGAQLAELGPHAAQFLLDRFAGGVWHGTIRIVGFDLIIGQGIDQIFLTHILEEVFLSPTLEHAIGQNDSPQVPATGDDGRLVPALGQASDLAEAKFSFEEAHGLLVEKVAHAPSVQLGFVLGETRFRNPPGTPLAIGQKIKVQGQQLAKQFGTPAPTVKDHRSASLRA